MKPIAKTESKGDETTIAPRHDVAGMMVMTRVANSDATGYTIFESDDSALFVPSTPSSADTKASAGHGAYEPQRYASRDDLETIYPQWKDADPSGSLGEATRLIGSAKSDLIELGLSGQEPSSVASRLVLAENALFRALDKARGAETLYSAISFCAWAIRNSVGQEIGSQQLDKMVACLGDVERRPFLSVAKLGEIVSELEDVGWNGDSPITNAFREGIEETFTLGFE